MTARSYRLTAEQIDALIEESERTHAPLDALINLAIFGALADTPEQWGDWPEEARRSWDRAMRRWCELHPLPETQWTRASQPLVRMLDPGIMAIWEAVESLAPDPGAWWLLPDVTWDDLSRVSGISPRRLIHLARRQGWTMEGRGPERAVALAPCTACREPHPPQSLTDRLCPSCR